MREVQVITHHNRLTASASDLAADYKARGFEKHEAWDTFIRDRALKPEMNAKEFYEIFRKVTPDLLDKPQTVQFHATHHDTFLDAFCEVRQSSDGVLGIIWEFGMTGSYPPCHRDIFDERFKKLEGENL